MDYPYTQHQQLFRDALVMAYGDLFTNDPEYAYSASRCTPESLADKMTRSMLANSANHTGDGFKRVCKAMGIKHTRTAIREYLTRPDRLFRLCGHSWPWALLYTLRGGLRTWTH